MTPRGKEAERKKTYALPEIVLNDYLRKTPRSGWTQYLKETCTSIDKLAAAIERALAANIEKHGPTDTWKTVDNKPLFKDKFLRHFNAARVQAESVPKAPGATNIERKAHKDSAIANAMFLAYFDLKSMSTTTL